MRFRFDFNYIPPAGAMEVHLVNPKNQQRTAALPAFVDTGADVTIVPTTYLKEISASAVDRRFLRSHWGERRSVKLYAISIQLGEINLPELRVVGDNRSDEILIGRDVLNQLRLLWDGPQLALEVLE